MFHPDEKFYSEVLGAKMSSVERQLFYIIVQQVMAAISLISKEFIVFTRSCII